ncbi:MAG: SIR2 family protein [Promethearchaeota archaeon]
MNVILFLGSGISFSTGLPNVIQITESLLNDKWFDHSDLTFVKGEHPSEYFRSQNLVPRLQSFLKIIKEYIDNFLKKRYNVTSNYEDLFYICKQIHDHETGEIDNPALIPFIEYLYNQIRDLCVPIPTRPELKINLKFLAERSCDFIQNVVWHSLSTNKDPSGMDLIIELAHSKEIEKLIIFTLNHDLLIEKILTKNNLSFIDGFDKNDGDIRYFNPNLYSNDANIYLFKLHGSINWYRFRIYDKNNNVTIDRYGMLTGNDPNHVKDKEGNYIDNIAIHPIFLTGSYNKLFSYNFGIFHILSCLFDDFLSKSNLLIMSGYGWNDKGINGRLFQWLRSSLMNKIILLHRKPEEKIKKGSKSPMWHSYDDLVKDGRLIPVKKWFSEVNIDLIKQYY